MESQLVCEDTCYLAATASLWTPAPVISALSFPMPGICRGDVTIKKMSPQNRMIITSKKVWMVPKVINYRPVPVSTISAWSLVSFSDQWVIESAPSSIEAAIQVMTSPWVMMITSWRSIRRIPEASRFPSRLVGVQRRVLLHLQLQRHEKRLSKWFGQRRWQCSS